MSKPGDYKAKHSGFGTFVTPLKEQAILELENDLKLRINEYKDINIIIGRMREIQRKSIPPKEVILWQTCTFKTK